ncbi:conserved hypothetical protein [Azospirillaceae bacterium]
MTGYVGVTSTSGSRFTTEPASLRPVLEALKKRGLLILDSRAAPGSLVIPLATELDLPRIAIDRVIDTDPSRAAIDDQLTQLEALAAKNGSAIGLGEPFPTTLERVAQWAPLLSDKKLILAPVSALVSTQKAAPAKPGEGPSPP